jgi:hypothetical protein
VKPITRNNYLDALVSITGIPFLKAPFPDEREGMMPDIIILCMGLTGLRIWSRLICTKHPHRVLPLVATKGNVLVSLKALVPVDRFILCSRLDEEVLRSTIDAARDTLTSLGWRVDGFYLMPPSTATGERIGQAVENLENLRRLGWKSTIIAGTKEDFGQADGRTMYAWEADIEYQLLEAVIAEASKPY